MALCYPFIVVRPDGWCLMGWGRMDDGFDEHPKVLALLDEEEPAEAHAAITLWTLCFSWAHRNTRRRGKTPGLIPSGLPRRQLGPFGRDAAKVLVRRGLWDEHPDGWLIHDFADYLPDAETRAARAEAGRRGAAKRWAEKHAAEAAAAEPDGKVPSENGKPPRADGNEPPASHEPDSKSNGNRVASDGSRARARRVTTSSSSGGLPEPTPEPIPPSAGARKSRQPTAVNAGDVVGVYFDATVKAGHPKPGDGLRARVGRQARKLLADPDQDPELILEAAREMGHRGWHDLEVQMQRTSAERNGARASPNAPYRNQQPEDYEWKKPPS